MRNFIFFFVPLAAVLVISAGCEPEHSASSSARVETTAGFAPCQEYQPARIVFLPLTEITPASGAGQSDTITAYVALQDSAGSAIKTPAVFRFEIYQFKPLSTDPRGKRLYIWDDIDLTSFKENSSYWRDFLRAYEFKFQCDFGGGPKYVLELTCMLPSDTRLIEKTVIEKPTAH
jgi:hypothetical protein